MLRTLCSAASHEAVARKGHDGCACTFNVSVVRVNMVAESITSSGAGTGSEHSNTPKFASIWNFQLRFIARVAG